MLHPDDGYRTENVASGDHRECLFNRDPPNLGGLVNFRLPDPLGTMRQVQVLRKVRIADDRLAGQDVFQAARTPAGLLQPLTVHHPLVRVRHVPTLPARQSRTEESRGGHLSAAGAAK